MSHVSPSPADGTRLTSDPASSPPSSHTPPNPGGLSLSCRLIHQTNKNRLCDATSALLSKLPPRAGSAAARSPPNPNRVGAEPPVQPPALIEPDEASASPLPCPTCCS